MTIIDYLITCAFYVCFSLVQLSKGNRMPCAAITKKGTACKYAPKFGAFCGVHKNVAEGDTTRSTSRSAGDVPLPCEDIAAQNDHHSCPICYDECSNTNSERLTCGHVFHTGCVRIWLARHPTCPMCRAPQIHAQELASGILRNAAATPLPSDDVQPVMQQLASALSDILRNAAATPLPADNVHVVHNDITMITQLLRELLVVSGLVD